MKDSHSVIIAPLLTEKAMALKESDNKVSFRVAKDANKIEVKKAVEEIFKVKVEDVTTVNCKGKKKRFGRFEGKRSDWKKAVVTLKEGEKLDIVHG